MSREGAARWLATMARGEIEAVRAAGRGVLRAVTPVPQLGLTGDRLRAVRAVEVLDRAGTPEARRLLTEWVGRMADPVLAAEVVFALNRSQANSVRLDRCWG